MDDASRPAERRWLPTASGIALVVVMVGGVLILCGSFEESPRWRPGPSSLEEAEDALDSMVRGAAWDDDGRNAQGQREAVHTATGLRFVLIPPGSFDMGFIDDPRGTLPGHGVTMGAFLLAKTECTQRAWDRIGGEDRRTTVGPDLPIHRVSWTAASEWCAKADLRLPSEAEWEYACRAGSTSQWCFGDDESRLGLHAAYRDGSAGPQVVGGRLPNAWGLHDGHGNVWEWCEDWFENSYDRTPRDGSPHDNRDSGSRVRRGGCWLSPARACRSAWRSFDPPGASQSPLGLRPAANLGP